MNIIVIVGKNKIFKKVVAGFGVVAGIVVLYLAFVYGAVFVPAFTRYVPSDRKNIKHFKEKQYYDAYKIEKNWFEEQNAQEISIKSFDGLKLVAYNLPNKNPVGTIILMHGYHSEPLREYAALVHFYYDLGYNIVMPVQRTHGDKKGFYSEGKYITFGIKERYDLRDWILKANQIYGDDTPLFLQGISMGCATVVMALGLELPSNVCGVIADCGFTAPRAIIWKVLKNDMKLPTARMIIKIGNFLTNKLAGFDMDDYSTFDAINFNINRINQIPILFIHGTKDDFVPIDMSRQNFAKCLVTPYYDLDGGVKIQNNSQQEKYSLVELDGAVHAIENFMQPATYKDAVSKFLEKYNRASETYTIHILQHQGTEF
ncbi:MAG: alpha/beta hydrolase [Treponema sp.]|nr:alpha/beta hydrolase [Treponema sp.]